MKRSESERISEWFSSQKKEKNLHYDPIHNRQSNIGYHNII